jgi:hypothetical protein
VIAPGRESRRICFLSRPSSRHPCLASLQKTALHCRNLPYATLNLWHRNRHSAAEMETGLGFLRGFSRGFFLSCYSPDAPRPRIIRTNKISHNRVSNKKTKAKQIADEHPLAQQLQGVSYLNST